jgi:hypothetical protein
MTFSTRPKGRGNKLQQLPHPKLMLQSTSIHKTITCGRVISGRQFGIFVLSVYRDIKAPDKWEHFTGRYVSQKLLSKHMNKYLSAFLIMSAGLYKEYEDAYRKGWSTRDIAADVLGIVSAM